MAPKNLLEWIAGTSLPPLKRPQLPQLPQPPVAIEAKEASPPTTIVTIPTPSELSEPPISPNIGLRGDTNKTIVTINILIGAEESDSSVSNPLSKSSDTSYENKKVRFLTPRQLKPAMKKGTEKAKRPEKKQHKTCSCQCKTCRSLNVSVGGGSENKSELRQPKDKQHRNFGDKQIQQHQNNTQQMSKISPQPPALKPENCNRPMDFSTFLRFNDLSRVVSRSHCETVIREDVFESPHDPRPNAYFDESTSLLRVYRGNVYGSNPNAMGTSFRWGGVATQDPPMPPAAPVPQMNAWQQGYPVPPPYSGMNASPYSPNFPYYPFGGTAGYQFNHENQCCNHGGGQDRCRCRSHQDSADGNCRRSSGGSHCHHHRQNTDAGSCGHSSNDSHCGKSHKSHKSHAFKNKFGGGDSCSNDGREDNCGNNDKSHNSNAMDELPGAWVDDDNGNNGNNSAEQNNNDTNDNAWGTGSQTGNDNDRPAAWGQNNQPPCNNNTNWGGNNRSPSNGNATKPFWGSAGFNNSNGSGNNNNSSGNKNFNRNRNRSNGGNSWNGSGIGPTNSSNNRGNNRNNDTGVGWGQPIVQASWGNPNAAASWAGDDGDDQDYNNDQGYNNGQGCNNNGGVQESTPGW